MAPGGNAMRSVYVTVPVIDAVLATDGRALVDIRSLESQADSCSRQTAIRNLTAFEPFEPALFI